MSKKSSIMERSWNSLTQLKEYFEKEKIETVVNFNGEVLETKKAYYKLAFGKLSRVIK